MLRILAAALLVVAVMVVIKDGRLLAHAGLVGSCSAVEAPKGAPGSWTSCRPGKLEGRPDLTRNSCVSAGLVGTTELWRCPAPLGGIRPAA